MNKKDFAKSFMTAALMLPDRFSRAAFALSESEQQQCEAFRLRLMRPAVASCAGQNVTLSDASGPLRATRDEMDALIARVTGSSVHSFNSQMIQGFITGENGHRIGLCGDLAMENGRPLALRSISSINLRIAKQVVGLSEHICAELYGGGFESTLILAPPGAGKTTLLRDMARLLSMSYNVSLLDERQEISACRQGVPQFDIGRCDVLTGCPKPGGIEMLVRAMGPHIIALDEITGSGDARAVIHAAYCGCRFLTTVHGSGADDLARRPVYRELMEAGIFRHVIVIENNMGRRSYRLLREGGQGDGQADGACVDHRLVLGGGDFHEPEPARANGGAAKLYSGFADY